MSEQTTTLLHLFSKMLKNPKLMMAVRMEFMGEKLRQKGNRTGASGLLVELWREDGLTNAQISELLDIKPSSVTAQVKNLEEAGMIERRQDENDKRVSRVFLTEKGKAAKDERETSRDDMSEQIFGMLSEEEQAQLARLLQKINDNQEEFDWEDFVRPPFGGGGFGFGPRGHLGHRPPHHPEDWRAMAHQHKEMAKQMRDQMKEELRAQWEEMSRDGRPDFPFSAGFPGDRRPDFDGPRPPKHHHDEPKKPEKDDWTDF